MSKPRIAINGFGRIGRCVTRIAKLRNHYDVVAINDIATPEQLAYAFKYDSIHGKYPGQVKLNGDVMEIDGDPFKVLCEKDPSKLPWAAMDIDFVIESSGKFRKLAQLQQHLDAGAKRVIVTVPTKEPLAETLVMGVNDHVLQKRSTIISNASCTPNCAAPIAKILDEHFGIKYGLMTNLAGKLDGIAMRVPVADGSVVDLTVELNCDVTVEMINAAMQRAALGPLFGILEYCQDPIVSSDIVGNTHSSIFDAGLTQVIGRRLVKVVSWYDNEWGYSTRIEELINKMAQLDK